MEWTIELARVDVEAQNDAQERARLAAESPKGPRRMR